MFEEGGTSRKVLSEMNIAQSIGYLISRTSRVGIEKRLKPKTVAKIGGVFWKNMSNAQKRNYLNKMVKILMKDNPDYDPHLAPDDPLFQNTVIGEADLYIQRLYDIFNDKFRDGVLNFPKALLDIINTNLGGYTLAGLLDGLVLYQSYKYIKESRARRYREFDDNGKGYDAIIVPINIDAKNETFKRYNMIAEGCKILSSMDGLKQFELIQQALAGGTLSGYPDFESQDKDTMIKDTETLLSVNKIKLKIPEVNDIKYIDSKFIFDLIKNLDSKKIYLPFMQLYRTHWTKVRSVFGGNYALKLLGCLFVVSKHLGYTKDIAEKLKYPVNEDKYDVVDNPTKILTYLNIPYISQLNWDTQNELYRSKLPPYRDGVIQSVGADFIKDKFGLDVPNGEYWINVVGDDYSKFDTTVIEEDIEWVCEHRFWGKIFKYVFNCLKYSEVWLGGHRISDIFFKSGHPFTADWGTDIHKQRNWNARDYIRKKFPDAFIEIADTNQSDDSIIFVITNVKDIAQNYINYMVEYLEQFKLIVHMEDSSDLMRDHYIVFLQMVIGWVLRNVNEEDGYVLPQVVGNPISRYAKLAHSERDISTEKVSSGALVGVYRVTGDPMLDAAISKLASFGRHGGEIVMTILRIIKDTVFGRKIIKAISEIDPDRSYELYRSDVTFGMNPAWLGMLEVQDLLVRDWFKKATSS